MDVNMANVCVSVLGEYKMILRRNNTKASPLNPLIFITLNLFLFMMLLLSYLEKQAGHTLKTEDQKSELEAI